MYEVKDCTDVVNFNGAAATRDEIIELHVKRGYLRLG